MKLHWEECTFFFSIRHNPVWKLSWWVWLNRVGPEVLWFIHGQFVQFFLPISNESLQFVVLYYRRKDKSRMVSRRRFYWYQSAITVVTHAHARKKGVTPGHRVALLGVGLLQSHQSLAGCRRHGYLPGGRHLHSADIGKSPQMAKSPPNRKDGRARTSASRNLPLKRHDLLFVYSR